MGLFDIFRAKGTLPVKVVDAAWPAEDGQKIEEIYDYLVNSGIGGIAGDRHNFLAAIKDRATNKRTRFMEYDEIARDPLVTQPLEMMVDDAVLMDEDREQSFWIESKDNGFESKINNFLAKHLEVYLPNIAFSLLSRGEFALKINRRGGEVVSLSPVTDIWNLHRVLEVSTGATKLFASSEDIGGAVGMSADGVKEMPWKDFAHYVNPSYQYSQRVKIREKEYYVISAESLFTDKLIETYRTLSYLEQGIIKARTAKSKVVRIFNVDVTGLSPAKAQAVIQYINGLVNAEEMLDQGSAFYEATHARPGPVSCVMPVRGEKGKIDAQEFSPSADIKDIVDIEYFRDKLLSGLRVPKQFLGYGDEMLPGVGSSGSLMRIDVRYARMVKRLRRRLRDGIHDTIQKAYPDAPDYKIIAVPVSSPEDEERHQEIEQRISVGQSLFDALVNNNTMELDREKTTMLRDFYTSVIRIPSLAKYLGKVASKTELFAKPTTGDENVFEDEDE